MFTSCVFVFFQIYVIDSADKKRFEETGLVRTDMDTISAASVSLTARPSKLTALYLGAVCLLICMHCVCFCACVFLGVCVGAVRAD